MATEYALQLHDVVDVPADLQCLPDFSFHDKLFDTNENHFLLIFPLPCETRTDIAVFLAAESSSAMRIMTAGTGVAITLPDLYQKAVVPELLTDLPFHVFFYYAH